MHGGDTFLVDESCKLLSFKPENEKWSQFGDSWAIGYVFENGVPNVNIKPEKVEDLKTGMEMTLFSLIYVDAWTLVRIKKIEQIS